MRLARELITTCRALTRAVGELDQELEHRTAEIAPALLQLPGCAAPTAAKLLAEIGPIDRFRSDAQLAGHGGAGPLEASSGRTQRHRLDRGGNHQLNAGRIGGFLGLGHHRQKNLSTSFGGRRQRNRRSRAEPTAGIP